MISWLRYLFLCIFFLGGCDERSLGNFIKEDMVSDKGYSVIGQLYSVPRYAPERNVSFWCKTENTKGIDLKNMRSPSTLKIPGAGWNIMGGSTVSLVNTKPVLNRIPLERIHIVDQNFIYIDMGLSVISISFNGCQNITELYYSKIMDIVFDNPSKKAPLDYFRQNGGNNFEGLDNELFSGYKRTPENGFDEVCFHISPAYLKRPDIINYDICTRDKGATWFSVKIPVKISLYK